MDDNEIMSRIHSQLSPVEVQEWFRAAAPEIRDAVVTLAQADGLDVAVKEVKALYIAWLQQPRKT